jgi:hypothetical protein
LTRPGTYLDLVGTSHHLFGGDPRRTVFNLERQSVPRSRHVDKDRLHPESLRAISYLPTFGGKLSTFGCVNHPKPPSTIYPCMQASSCLLETRRTKSNFGCLWRFRHIVGRRISRGHRTTRVRSRGLDKTAWRARSLVLARKPELLLSSNCSRQVFLSPIISASVP